MKEVSIKISHAFLVVLLLLSTMGISVEKHYCMGRLKAVAIFHQVENCFGGDTETQMPCCEDVHEELKVDDLNPSTFDFKLSPQAYQLVFNVFPSWVENFYFIEEDNHLVIIKSPPPPLLNLNIAHQVFLI